MSKFIFKRDVNYFWEITMVRIAKPLIVKLIDTPITPNMVTFVNMLLVFPIICLLSCFKQYYVVALMVQLYIYLDVVDGNLARNKNMQSALGKKLDIISDTLFCTVGVFLIGIATGCNIILVVATIIIHQVYGLIATYYIVPRIRKCKEYKHTKLKEYFEKRGYIFGMDYTLEGLIISIMLLFPQRTLAFIILPILWIVDMIYRIYELKRYN